MKGASTQASSSGGFSLSLIAKARTGSQDLRKLGTKVLSENSVKYWTALGGPRKIWELRRETGVAAWFVLYVTSRLLNIDHQVTLWKMSPL
jgi:hypothetical protein